MAYVVEFPHNYYLRGTTATGDPERATRFATEAEARAALQRNRKFLRAAVWKAAKIVQVLA